MVRSVRERINLTADIRAIIDGYPSDSSLLRELLQNSDDAGATEQVFILDNRQHGASSIIQPNLAGSQGPALLCSNNSTFDESNWNAISTTHSSDKIADVRKIGKYGVGFRSVYHITDNPHVLSLDTLLILDPHYRFPDYAGGAEIRLSEEGHAFTDQLSAFTPILDPECIEDVDGHPGTIIRLPLRTPAQAQESEIKDAPVSPDSVRELLYSFAEEDLDECLLFLRNIHTISIREITADGRDILISSCQIDDVEDIQDQRAFFGGPEEGFESYRCQVTTTKRDRGEGGMLQELSRSWRICQSSLDANATAEVLCKRLRKKTDEDKEDVKERMTKDKLFSHVALACPLPASTQDGVETDDGDDDALDGRLFTLLPLPISTCLPVHMHGVFALMSNRQSLDIITGKQKSLHIKERLRVQWNFSIFEDFIPPVYARLLSILIEEENLSPWELWRVWPSISPASGNDRYWRKLPKLVIRCAVQEGYPIFPRFQRNRSDNDEDDDVDMDAQSSGFVKLEDTFIASSEDDEDVLEVLSDKLDIAVVLPPENAMAVLQESECEYKELTPESLAEDMRNNPPDFDVLSPDDKATLLSYLTPVSPKSLPRILFLPLIPLLDGTYASLQTPLRKPKPGQVYILMDEIEQDLFADYNPQHTISLASLSSRVRQILAQPEASKYVNVTRMTAEDVEDFLHARFGKLTGNQGDTVRGHDAHKHIPWLIKFWVWASAWESDDDDDDDDENGIENVMKATRELYLIPTEDDTLRTLKGGFVDSDGMDKTAKLALRGIGVPFVHPKLASSMSLFWSSKAAHPSKDVGYVLDTIDTSRIGRIKNDRDVIRGFFVDRVKKTTMLTAKQKEVLFALPMYATLVPLQDGDLKNVVGSSLRKVGKAEERLVYIGVQGCPLPIQKGVVYVDCTEANTRAIVEFASSGSSPARSNKKTSQTLSEIEILIMSIPFLDDQPIPVLEKLVSRIVPRLQDIPSAAKEQLGRTAFIPIRIANTVPGRGNKTAKIARVSPGKIIDPQSGLAALYDIEEGVFPGSPFSEPPFLNVMRSHGFFAKDLTAAIVSDRIDYIAKQKPTASACTVVKAQKLLSLLDDRWEPELGSAVSRATQDGIAWLPCFPTKASSRGVFYSANKCRDRLLDTFLFDLVLKTLDGPKRIQCKELRALLGWNTSLPFSVLKSQFQKALPFTKSMEDRSRLLAIKEYLIKALTSKHISTEDVIELGGIVGDKPWFVLSSRGETLVLASRHVVLSQDSEIKSELNAFRVISPGMLESHGDFLRLMGCNERPHITILLAELDGIAGKKRSREDLSRALEILREIASQSRLDMFAIDEYRAHILIPDEKEAFHSMDLVYYDDLRREIHDVVGWTSKFSTHGAISKALSKQLGLQFASSAELGETLDIDELQMEEKLDQRIANILQGYNVNYALNEYLANAADAHATKFSIMLDEQRFPTDRLLTPGMTMLQKEALLLYNNAIFQEKDFHGLCNIGKGGKDGEANTIGRFGLGAISMFHFTDVAIIVSQQHAMLVDPFGRCLPPLPGRKRTVLLRPLKFFWDNYPDVLTPFIGLFGFEKGTTDYAATIFRLPLNHKFSRRACYELLRGCYCNLACHALLFTELSSITAIHRRGPAGTQEILWKVTSTTHPSSTAENGMTAKYVHLHPRENVEEKWLITTSNVDDIPETHLQVLRDHRFLPRNTAIRLQLALCLSPLLHDREYYLFSSLMLPHVTSLPLHLDAQFALASDRRSIRFDPPTASGTYTPEAAYNMWILSSLVTPLYTFSLSHIARYDIKSLPGVQFDHWWPRHSDDAISQEVTKAFYTEVVSTAHPICSLFGGSDSVAPRNATFSLNEDPLVTEVLRQLEVDNLIKLSPNIRGTVSQLEVKLPSVTAIFVRDVIEAKSKEFHQLFRDEEITMKDIEAILTMLLDAKVSLTDLPILPTEAALKDFRREGPVIYAYDSPSPLPGIFPPQRFLDRRLLPRIANALQEDATLNICPLDVGGIVSMIQDKVHPASRSTPSRTSRDWMTRFWTCPDMHPFMPDLAKHDEFALLPLFRIISQDGECVSFQHAKTHCLLPNHQLSDLTPIIRKLGCLIIKEQSENQRAHFLTHLQSFSLESFVRHSAALNLPWDTLSREECLQLSRWIQAQVPVISKLPPELKKTLCRFPIWEVWNTNTTSFTFANADSVSMMLPMNMSLKIAQPYIRRGLIVTEYSIVLVDLQKPNPSGSSMMHATEFPESIKETEEAMNGFSQFLDRLLQLVNVQILKERLKIPNANLEMTSPAELFDATVAVFESSFQRTRADFFVHPALRDRQPQLCRVGLQHAVDTVSLYICAETFHNELEEYGDTENTPEQVETADQIYQHYAETLPPLIPVGEACRWERFDDLRFIPRRIVRRDNAEYDVEIYCVPLPFIAAPNDLALPSLESICWTQRGCVETDPIIELRATGWKFGVPTVSEVVAHLVTLTSRVARDHPRTDSVLTDLQATYEWLNQPDHAADAKEDLRRRRHDKIFLNVDDPHDDEWEWRSADVLVAGLHFDGGGLTCIRDFLSNYPNLLKAAGAGSLADPTYRRPERKNDELANIRSTFNSMREEGHYTDMFLVPKEATGVEDDDEVRDKLRFHRDFLAAAIPHLRHEVLTGAFESEGDELPFDGTLFGAMAVLEFAYTGDIQIPQPETDEEASTLLGDLLQLLPIADEWDMQALKDLIGTVIASTHKLVTPETHKRISRQAERYNVESLVEFCAEFKRKNATILQRLSS